ncbi:MAG: hypothetical protein ABJA67_10645, partial [Chthonomonadales bacterium]
MKQRFLILTALILPFTGSMAERVLAQAPPPVTLFFHVPEEVDPNNVIIFNTPSGVKNASGADLVNLGFPSFMGVEIHSVVPGVAPGSIKDVVGVTICLNYSGTVTPDTTDVNTSGFYPAWLISGGSIGDNRWCFTFTQPTGGAPINDNLIPGHLNPMLQSFGTATVLP